MERIILEVNLIKYVEEKHEYVAEWLEEKIIVDPYVGCVWEDKYIKIGKVIFEGFWGSEGAFLPTKEIAKKEEVEDVNRIPLLQYKNLRKHFSQLVEDVLGKDYYNEGMDIYTCDEYCCRDLKKKLKEERV